MEQRSKAMSDMMSLVSNCVNAITIIRFDGKIKVSPQILIYFIINSWF